MEKVNRQVYVSNGRRFSVTVEDNGTRGLWTLRDQQGHRLNEGYGSTPSRALDHGRRALQRRTCSLLTNVTT